MTEWLDKWKRNGWQTSQAGPVKNKEDIVQLDNACQKIDVKWVSVYIYITDIALYIMRTLSVFIPLMDSPPQCVCCVW